MHLKKKKLSAPLDQNQYLQLAPDSASFNNSFRGLNEPSQESTQNQVKYLNSNA
jgi:hypothetical protein